MNYKKLISIITVSSIVCALLAVGGCAAKKMAPSAMATYSPVKATSVSETSVSEAEPEVEAVQEQKMPAVTPSPKMSEEERIAMARKAAEIAKQDKKDEPADTEDKEVDEEAPPADGQPAEAPSQQAATQQPVQQSTSTQTPAQSQPAQQSTPPSSTPAESGHVHSWVEQTTTVHHDEVGHYETVVVKEAWDEPVYEEVPVYEDKCYSKCTVCGASFKNMSNDETTLHMLACNSSAINYWESVQVGTEKRQTGSVHHDAVTEQRWVIDKAAYDETVVIGYACSCGATK